MITPAEQLEELWSRMQAVDLPTLLALDRELQVLLEQKKAEHPRSEHGTIAREEFIQQYPHLAIDPDLFALVGIHPATPVEEDKTLIREQIFRRLAE
jgi:hypothetical protein